MPDYVPIQDLTIVGSVADSDLFPMSDGSGAYAVRGSTIKSWAASDAEAAAADAALSKTAAQDAARDASDAQTAAEAAQAAAEDAISDASAIAGDQSKINANLGLNVTDVFQNASKNNRSYRQVDFTWNADGSCTVMGKATGGYSFCSLYSGAWPSWIQPGKTYRIQLGGTNVQLRFSEMENGSVVNNFAIVSTEDTVTMPTTVPTTVRIALYVPSGVTANETVHPRMLTGFPIGWDLDFKFRVSESLINLPNMIATPIITGTVDIDIGGVTSSGIITESENRARTKAFSLDNYDLFRIDLSDPTYAVQSVAMFNASGTFTRMGIGTYHGAEHNVVFSRSSDEKRAIIVFAKNRNQQQTMESSDQAAIKSALKVYGMESNSKLSADIDALCKYQLDTSTIQYSFGGLVDSGKATDSETRIRLKAESGLGAFRAGAGSTITANQGYKFSVAVYDYYFSASNFKLRSFKNISSVAFTLAEDAYIRVAIGTENDDILWERDEIGRAVFTPAGEAAKNGINITIFDSTIKDELTALSSKTADPFSSIFLLEPEIPLNAVDYHAQFDGMVENGQIYRTLLGNVGDDETLPVYLYKIRNNMDHIAPNYSKVVWNGSNELYSRPKIFISAGIHGNERTAPQVLFRFIDNLCNNVSFADMLNGFDWYFVPLINPWGFSHSAILTATGVVNNGNGYKSDTITNYTVIDNTSEIHQGIRRVESGLDANRDFGTFDTEEAGFVRDALTSINSDNRDITFAMDMHQASGESAVYNVCAFLSLSYGATDADKSMIYSKWMQAAGRSENILASYYDTENVQSMYTWDGTDLDTLRNYLAGYATYATCFEGGATALYYSGSSDWSNPVARAVSNTQMQIFMHIMTAEWM